MWPAADASLTQACYTPRPEAGERPLVYQWRLIAAVAACEERRAGWQRRDAELKALFTGAGDGE